MKPDNTAHSNLTRVSRSSCHRVTRHFFLTGQHGFLTRNISSPVKTPPGKSKQRICLCQVKEVFGSNRANFLTDRIQIPAKTTNIKKPTDLVKIPKMLDKLLFFTKNLENHKKIKKKNTRKPTKRERVGAPWGPLGPPRGGTQGSPRDPTPRGAPKGPQGAPTLSLLVCFLVRVS